MFPKDTYLENRIPRIKDIMKHDTTSETVVVKTAERKQSRKQRNRKRPRTVTLYGKWEERLSKKEHGADALALRAEERRDKLRKAAGRSKYPVIRGCLNGGTHMEELHVSVSE